jgi:flagellar FliL protein
VAQELLRRSAPPTSAPEEAPPDSSGRRSAGTRKGGVKRAAKSETESGEEVAKKSKKKLIIICVVLLLVAFEAKGKIMKPHYAAGAKVPAGAIYALGDTSITTNLSDGHLAQIGISLQLSKPANTKLITTDVPELTNSTIRILSGETYDTLLGPTGRAQLSSALLASYQQDLGLSEGAQQVTAVYFTAFVLQ